VAKEYRKSLRYVRTAAKTRRYSARIAKKQWNLIGVRAPTALAHCPGKKVKIKGHGGVALL
jgi:hypothetical protein